MQARGEPTEKYTKKMPKNITTQWPKKGTYGCTGTTIGKLYDPKLSEKNSNKVDLYDALRMQEREEWKLSKKKIIGSGIFQNCSRQGYTFDEKGKSGLSSAYDFYDPAEHEKKGGSKRSSSKKASSIQSGWVKEERPPFKYTDTPKSGESGFLNKFPNAVDPDWKPKDAGKKKRPSKPKPPIEGKPLGGPWRPVSHPKTDVYRSLLRRFV